LKKRKNSPWLNYDEVKPVSLETRDHCPVTPFSAHCLSASKANACLPRLQSGSRDSGRFSAGRTVNKSENDLV
jgi:hypothetical protein